MMRRRTQIGPFFALLAVLTCAATAAADGPAASAAAPTSSSAAATSDGMSEGELEKMLAPLVADDLEARKTAAKSVGDLGQDALPAITKKLAELRKAPS